MFDDVDKWIKIIGLITAVLGIPIAIITIYDRLSKNNKSEIYETNVGTTNFSDLIVSSFESSDRLKPLDGYSVIKIGNKTIFTGGVDAYFTFSHNAKGLHPIVVTGMKLNLVSYDPTEIPKYAYKIDSSSIIGAGKVKSNVFSISLNGETVSRATKLVNDKSTISLSDNFFESSQPEKIALKPANDYPEEVQVKVTAWENGLYKIYFSIDYHVAGEDRHKKTETISIYYWEN